MTRARRLIPIIASLAIAAGCARTMTERIVSETLRGNAYNATYAPLPGGDPRQLAALVRHFTEQLKIDVEFLPADDEALHDAYGVSYTAGDQRFIKVSAALSVNGQIEVLAHEGAHLFQLPSLTRSEGDVFADIVCAHVAARLGVPQTVETSAHWLQQHKPHVRVALDLEREIQYVTGILMPAQ